MNKINLICDDINYLIHASGKYKDSSIYHYASSLLFRKCYQEIYLKMKKHIEQPGIIESGGLMKIQNCFLVYGNEGVGKTSFCIFLTYCFNNDEKFKDYDIYVIRQTNVRGNTSTYIYRKAKTSEFVPLQKMYMKRKKTIVISDNVVIHEDDYSEDDVVIMISSPNAEKYKIMSNKRAPIQYWIPKINDEELNIIAEIRFTQQNEDERKQTIEKIKEFGYEIEGVGEETTFDEYFANEEVELKTFIPPSYNEKCFIYDTNEVDVIPNTITFKSDAIRKYILSHKLNTIKKYNELLQYYKNYKDGWAFERLCHIILEAINYSDPNFGYTLENICTPENVITYVDKNSLVDIYKTKIEEVGGYYFEFSRINTFPGIDGCFLYKYKVTGVQMTISPHHPTKDNMFYNKQKEYIIAYLKNLLENPDNCYKAYYYLDVIKYGMYYLGYIPAATRTEIDTEKNYEDMKVLYESYFLINEIQNRKDIPDRDNLLGYYGSFKDVFLNKLEKQIPTDKYQLFDKLKIIENSISQNLIPSSPPHKRENAFTNRNKRKSRKKGVNDDVHDDDDSDDDEEEDEDEGEEKGEDEDDEDDEEYYIQSNHVESAVSEEEANSKITSLKNTNSKCRTLLNNNNNKIIKDLDDYLYDQYYWKYLENYQIITFKNSILDAIGRKINTMSKNELKGEIDELKNYNPLCHIVFVSDCENDITSDLVESDNDFSNYDVFQNEMKNEMNKLYKDDLWKTSSKDKKSILNIRKRIILSIKSKRLRFSTYHMTDDRYNHFYTNHITSTQPVTQIRIGSGADNTIQFEPNNNQPNNNQPNNNQPNNNQPNNISNRIRIDKNRLRNNQPNNNNQPNDVNKYKFIYSDKMNDIYEYEFKRRNSSVSSTVNNSFSDNNNNNNNQPNNPGYRNNTNSLLKIFENAPPSMNNYNFFYIVMKETNEIVIPTYSILNPSSGYTSPIIRVVNSKNYLTFTDSVNNYTLSKDQLIITNKNDNRRNTYNANRIEEYNEDSTIITYKVETNIININCNIYQYPLKKVYVRPVYEDIWKELKKHILCVKLHENYNKIMKILHDEYNMNLDDAKENVNNLGRGYHFLLRGNPGCGKTSFIIYLLTQINDLGKIIGEINTSLFKNSKTKTCDDYYFENSKITETPTKRNINYDIAISDSYDLKYDIDSNAKIFLYVTSPDVQSYESYRSYKRHKMELYMDVFSDYEIIEWEKYCLPQKLRDSIIRNNFNKKYGNVPRHIYYAAIYDVCYGKDYWNEMYTCSINKIISDTGYINFIKKYLYPINNDTDTISTKKVIFDSTLCHYIVKYSYIDYKTIDDFRMEFISDEVYDYIMDSIRTKSGNEEINEIENKFKGIFDKTDNPLHQMFFQEITWCKLLYNVPNNISLENITTDEYNKFKGLFDSNIYSRIDGKYLLHFATLNNREMIYLMNNCFIHVLKKKINDKNLDMLINGDIQNCTCCLNRDLEWNDFNYVMVYTSNCKKATVIPEIEKTHLIFDPNCNITNYNTNNNIYISFYRLQYTKNDGFSDLVFINKYYY